MSKVNQLYSAEQDTASVMSSDREILSAALKIRKYEHDNSYNKNNHSRKNQNQAIDELKFLLSPKNALKSIDQ